MIRVMNDGAVQLSIASLLSGKWAEGDCLRNGEQFTWVLRMGGRDQDEPLHELRGLSHDEAGKIARAWCQSQN